MVYKNNHTPSKHMTHDMSYLMEIQKTEIATSSAWGELMKLDISSDVIEDCHLFFTFRNRQDKHNRNHATGNIDKPFAFAFLPLFSTNQTFIPDGEHNLALFKYDRQSATPEVYCRVNSSLEAGQTAPDITPALSKLLIPLKDAFVVRSFLCSTQHTQNEVLLKLIKWEHLLDQPQSLQETLTKLKFASEVEICKFLRNIFDALFGVLVSRVNGETKEYDDLVFNALVTLLGIVSDRRFTNFKPVVDLYIDQHFACTTASTHLIRSFQSLLSNPTSPQNAQPLRSSIKVWGYLLRFIVRSRELQRAKDLTSGGLTSDVIESKFKHEITSVLNQITALMSLNSSAVIGTQTLAVQHFASLLPELGKVCGPHELLEKANSFVESISATKGKIVIWKLLLQEHIIMSHIFDLPDCRVQLIPKLTAWVKPHLGEFEEYTMIKPKDTDSTKDSARVSWLEGIRISTSLIAVALDKLHEALIDPDINQDRTALAQEEDNVEYLLMLLPNPIPIVFPASYPFSLLSSLPTKPNFGQSSSNQHNLNQSHGVPSTQNGLGEIAAVMVTMILLSPDRLLSSFLEVMLENKVFPANWLNINILSHKISLKLVRVVARLMEREFIPPFTDVNQTPGSGDPSADPNRIFNSELWSDFFVLLHGLLSSPHLVIEEYPPQKRRAVWKLAGDVRGEGSKLLKRCWEAIGSQSLKAGDVTTTCGGYQIQFIPGIVELILELCLSHHDEMRTNAVTMVSSSLYSVMLTEYQANQDLTVVTDEIIDKLDSLLGNSPSSQNDEMSRAFFVGQLQSLFESDPIDERLQKQVESFMHSVNQFLELLLSIRNLPPGDEFIDDRVIGTLKLMSFIRNIGRSGIYIHYVHKTRQFPCELWQLCRSRSRNATAFRSSWLGLGYGGGSYARAFTSKQTAFRRKETLYLRILEYLAQGKAWESGIQICKELQEQYEHISFDYERLSEVLAHQSSLYHKIVKSERYFSEYFRVAFYGLGFPPSVQNRQFVYRGYEFEKYVEFCDRMNNKHPNAQIIRAHVVSSDELQYAEGQYLHITKVQAEPDRNSIIFTNLEVPNAVRQYYENNATNTFSYSRPFSKEEGTNLDPVMMWVEKTFLVCEDAFPTVLQRSEVLEIRFLEISPIENAILITDQKTRELDTLQRRYLALSKTGGTKLNTNPLSMALNGAVDAPANSGIPAFRNAFLRPEYLAQNPDQQETVDLLRQAIDNQTAVIDEGLKLHQALCPSEMKTFHATLYRYEISRLPVQTSTPLVFPSGANEFEDSLDFKSQFPSASLQVFDLGVQNQGQSQFHPPGRGAENTLGRPHAMSIGSSSMGNSERASAKYKNAPSDALNGGSDLTPGLQLTVPFPSPLFKENFMGTGGRISSGNKIATDGGSLGKTITHDHGRSLGTASHPRLPATSSNPTRTPSEITNSDKNKKVERSNTTSDRRSILGLKFGNKRNKARDSKVP
ncbi:dedicator of cytokinesis-domain-containing protein [Melampsora americana]|nr:dedicator of cytokinesis-domain-containing protein [Melampsora americana]